MHRIVPGPECGSCHMPPLSLRTLAHSSVESRKRSQIQASVAIQRPTPGSHDFFYRESVFIAHNTTGTICRTRPALLGIHARLAPLPGNRPHPPARGSCCGGGRDSIGLRHLEVAVPGNGFPHCSPLLPAQPHGKVPRRGKAKRFLEHRDEGRHRLIAQRLGNALYRCARGEFPNGDEQVQRSTNR